MYNVKGLYSCLVHLQGNVYISCSSDLESSVDQQVFALWPLLLHVYTVQQALWPLLLHVYTVQQALWPLLLHVYTVQQALWPLLLHVYTLQQVYCGEKLL